MPETSTLALVLGGSPLEQFWGKAIERELAPLGDRLRVLPAGNLSLEQMRQRVAALPPRLRRVLLHVRRRHGRRIARGRARAPRHQGVVERAGLRHFHRPARQGHRGRAARRLAQHGRHDGEAGRAHADGRNDRRQGGGAGASAGAGVRLARAPALGHSRVAAAARCRSALPAAFDLGRAPAADSGRRRRSSCSRRPSSQRCSSSDRAAGVPRWRPLA